MIENPWRHLPAEAPFVLPVDREGVGSFNKKVGRCSKCFLQIAKILPEPFIGDPGAPVVLLSNNPGFGKRAHLRETPDFMERMRNNVHFGHSEFPFIYLDPSLGEVGRWWNDKLKTVIEEFGTKVVARSFFNVVYFPYASERLGRKPPDLPSQQFSFGLVRAALSRRAIVIVMRKGKLKWWQDKVEELKGYDGLVLLNNPQNPTISRGNCCHSDYEKVIAAITAAQKPQWGRR